jgi:hypothetical protein
VVLAALLVPLALPGKVPAAVLLGMFALALVYGVISGGVKWWNRLMVACPDCGYRMVRGPTVCARCGSDLRAKPQGPPLH